MADALTIENTTKQLLEIELTMQGVDAMKETKVCFCIETEDMTLCFDGEKGESDTWKFNIPVLSQLKRTTYDYKIIVVTDGYYFEPAAGVVTVVGPRDIYTSAPKNVTLEPKKAKEEPKPKMVASADEEEKVVKKEEKKLDKKFVKKAVKEVPVKKKPEKKVEKPAEKKVEKKVEPKVTKKKKKVKEEAKPTPEKKVTFKQSVKDTASEILAEAVSDDVEPSDRDKAIKQALAEVKKTEKPIVEKKTIEVETMGSRKVLQFGDQKVIQIPEQPITPITHGKARFRDMALVEDVQEEELIQTEKDKEIADILRAVKPESEIVDKRPTIQFKKGKVVQ